MNARGQSKSTTYRNHAQSATCRKPVNNLSITVDKPKRIKFRLLISDYQQALTIQKSTNHTTFSSWALHICRTRTEKGNKGNRQGKITRKDSIPLSIPNKGISPQDAAARIIAAIHGSKPPQVYRGYPIALLEREISLQQMLYTTTLAMSRRSNTPPPERPKRMTLDQIADYFDAKIAKRREELKQQHGRPDTRREPRCLSRDVGR